MEIRKHGQIESLVIPGEWVEGPVSGGDGHSAELLRTITPKGGRTAKILLYYRGRPVSDASGKALFDLLEKFDGNFPLSEISELAEVFDWMAYETFEIKNVIVETIDRRKVLTIEGHYGPKNLDCHAVLLQNPKAHSFIQEIYYQAAADEYREFFEQARAAFSNIQWVV